jgi:hypothetical protein
MKVIEELKSKEKQLTERLSLLNDDIIPELTKDRNEDIKASRGQTITNRLLPSYFSERQELELQLGRVKVELKCLTRRENVAAATGKEKGLTLEEKMEGQSRAKNLSAEILYRSSK